MTFKIGWMSLLLATGCGVSEDAEPMTADPVTSLQQPMTAPQGKTLQGKTLQGKTLQGNTGSSLWVANTGGWKVRNASGYLVPVAPSLNGTQLSGIPAGGGAAIPVPVPASTGMIATKAVLTSTTAVKSTVPVLATFYVQEVGDPGMYGGPTIGTIVEARIIGSFLDNGPYGPGDATSLLAPQHRPATSPNRDIRFYQVQVKNPLGQWVNFCSTESGSPANAALFMPRYLGKDGRTYGHGQYLGMTCSDGTTAKCARWGYKWWRSLTPTGSSTAVSLAPLWEACYRAAMADYCENGESHTLDGTVIDIWDRYGFIAPVPESAPFGSPYAGTGPTAFSGEAAFNANGTVCLEKERYADLPAQCGSQQTFLMGNEYCSPNASLPAGTWSSCGPKGLVGPARIFNKGELATCAAQATAANDVPLVFVASWNTACTHSPLSQGKALAVDCNWLTRKVCQTAGYETCCGEDPAGNMTGTWTASCVSLANKVASATHVSPGGVFAP